MRHFLPFALTAACLPCGMHACSAVRALVAAARFGQRAATSLPGASMAAIDVAVVAARADLNLTPAALADIEPMVWLNRVADRRAPTAQVLDR